MMCLPGCSRGLKLLRDDATEYLQRLLAILRAKGLPEALQGYPMAGARLRWKKAPCWLPRMKFLLEWGDGSRTNQRASTKHRQTIPASWAKDQHGSVEGLCVYSFWGDRVHLDRFLQLYAVEVVKLQARAKGYPVTEQALADGGIRLQVMEGA
jgi:hypothetical protein